MTIKHTLAKVEEVGWVDEGRRDRVAAGSVLSTAALLGVLCIGRLLEVPVLVGAKEQFIAVAIG